MVQGKFESKRLRVWLRERTFVVALIKVESDITLRLSYLSNEDILFFKLIGGNK